MEAKIIKERDYRKILELDKKVYPTDSPVTQEIIGQWYQNNPEFGIMFEEKNEIKAMCVAIPLNKSGWNDLTKGKLPESGLNSKTIFNNSRDKEIGIHVYHLEKLDSKIKELYKISLKEIKKIIDKLRKNNPSLKIIGFSGLAVTSAGINLLYNKLNCRERNFLNDEHIMRKSNKLEIIKTNSKEDIIEKVKEGYYYLNRCKMLVLYQNEPSIVWNYLY